MTSMRLWKATSIGFAQRRGPPHAAGLHAGVSGAGDGRALHASRRARDAAKSLSSPTRTRWASRGLIVWKYVLRNSLISTVTQIGLLFGILLAGAVVIETVFQWPGIGTYAFEAILQSDYAAVMGFTVYAGGVFGIVNLMVDIAHAILDPRGGQRMTGSSHVLRKLLRDRSALPRAADHRAAGGAAAILAPLLATHPEAVWDMNPGQRLLPPIREWLLRHRPHGRRHLQPHPVRRSHHDGDRHRGGRRRAADRRADRTLVRAGTNWLGEALMRVSDIFLAVPQIVLAIAISQTLGPSIENVILALSVTYWPWFTRLVHAEVRSLKNETFIEAAIALGVPTWRIIAAARAAERRVADHRAHLDRHGLHHPHRQRTRDSSASARRRRRPNGGA